MAAELENPFDPANETPESPARARRTSGDGRATVGSFALVVAAAIVIIVVLTQCTARVPSIVGLDRKAAETRLRQSDLVLGDVSESLSSSRKTGLVDEQIPESGVMLRTGGTVDIILAKSTEFLTVPDVRGHDSASAAVELQQAGFDARPTEEYNDTVPIGAAISQSPANGTEAPRGSAVDVFLSLGPRPAVESAATPSDAAGGFTSAQGTTGSSNGDTPIISTVRAFPHAMAWSAGGDIFVRLTPGGGTRRVTSDSNWDTHPIVAPSGRYLVFMRAASATERSTSIGAVSFTTFTTHLLTKPKVDVTALPQRWVGAPAFAPKPDSMRPNSDVIVYPQYFPLRSPESDPANLSGQLLVTQVPNDSTWISWNNAQFRPIFTLKLSESGHVGCVRVRQYDGSRVRYDRDLFLPTGTYLRR